MEKALTIHYLNQTWCNKEKVLWEDFVTGVNKNQSFRKNGTLTQVKKVIRGTTTLNNCMHSSINIEQKWLNKNNAIKWKEAHQSLFLSRRSRRSLVEEYDLAGMYESPPVRLKAGMKEKKTRYHLEIINRVLIL